MKNKLDDIGWELGAAHGAYIEESDLKPSPQSWWLPEQDSSGFDDAGGPEAAERFANYSDNGAAELINVAPYEGTTSGFPPRDIYDDVVANSYDDDPGGSHTGPILTYTVG